jgi:hypothetical protein
MVKSVKSTDNQMTSFFTRMIVKYVPSIHLFSLMAPQQPKKVTMTTKMLTAMRMMADVEKTVIEKLFF